MSASTAAVVVVVAITSAAAAALAGVMRSRKDRLDMRQVGRSFALEQQSFLLFFFVFFISSSSSSFNFQLTLTIRWWPQRREKAHCSQASEFQLPHSLARSPVQFVRFTWLSAIGGSTSAAAVRLQQSHLVCSVLM